MAKLNGVQTVNMQDGKVTKISYGGAEYAKVDGIYRGSEVNDGDIGLVESLSSSGFGAFTDGGYYEMANRTDGSEFLRFKSDNHGDVNGRVSNGVTVFRKVNAKPTPLEAKVESLDKRVTALEATKQTPKTFEDFPKDAKVRLLSGGGESPLCGFTDGQTYEVVTNDYGHRRGRRIQLTGGSNPNGKGYATPEQLELVAKYKTVKRPAKVGERILITAAQPGSSQSYDTGEIFTVTVEDRPCKGDVRVAEQGSFIDYCEYEVIVEDAKPAKSLTHKGADYTLVSRKAQPGDVVVIPKGGNSLYFDEGKAYVVADKNHMGDVTAYGNDGDHYVLYKGVYNRTEENVLVYAPVAGKLKVGDTVEVLARGKGRYADLSTGVTGKITEITDYYADTPVRVSTSDDFDYFPATALRKVATKANPLIPQEGDIVRATNAAFNSGEPFKPGDIGIVKVADGTMQPLVEFSGITLYADVVVVSRAKDRVDVA